MQDLFKIKYFNYEILLTIKDALKGACDFNWGLAMPRTSITRTLAGLLTYVEGTSVLHTSQISRNEVHVDLASPLENTKEARSLRARVRRPQIIH